MFDFSSLVLVSCLLCGCGLGVPDFVFVVLPVFGFRIFGSRFVVCGLWFVVCSLWFVVCGL